MTKLYQNKQIRDLESFSIAENINDESGLMLNAGSAALEYLRERWPDAKHITICCGKGNNAGDGYVLARLAAELGLEVSVYALCKIKDLKGAALAAAQAANDAGVTIQPLTADTKLLGDVIVDALLGSGLKGEVKEPFIAAIATINNSQRPILALDIPSGLDVDTGNILGSAVKANATITFIGAKQGLYTHKGPEVCGEIGCNDLALPAKVFTQVNAAAELVQYDELKKLLPRRARDAHKGNYGHVLVIGGDYGMGGAVRMAAEAAMRTGAGLVTVATRPEHVSVVNCQRPEIMCHQVSNEAELAPLLKRATVIVIGPGLGQSDWAETLLDIVVKSDLPMLLDADALNLLSQAPKQLNNWILTPHPGEASRLLDCKSCEVQANRFASADELQKKYGGVIVLKGVGTIIKKENAIPKICPAGNPGMASGGMGDVLSGVIGGLLEQKLSLIEAAEAGVLVHALAADHASEEGGERGLLATDLMEHVRELVNPE